MTLVAYLDRLLEGMVHGSADEDGLEAMRHRQFLATHLAIGLLATCLLPIWLVADGPASLVEVATFAWFLVPIGAAALLSRTGNLAAAHLVAALGASGFIFWIAHLGGPATLALLWLPMIPLEASLSGSHRMIVAASAIAGLACGALFLLPGMSLPIETLGLEGGALAIVAGGLGVHAVSLAFRANRLSRFASGTAKTALLRYRTVADHATELVTRHAPDGDVVFASPVARRLTGCPSAELLRDGLFRRVHIGDRPAYLRALSEARLSGAPARAAIRLRQDAGAGLSGRYRDVEMRCLPGEVPGEVVAILRDVSDRLEAERKLQAALETAECASLAQGRHFADMSHQLRTPLNTIIGFAELLGRPELPRTGRETEYAGLILGSGKRLVALLESRPDGRASPPDLDVVRIEARSSAEIVDLSHPAWAEERKSA